MAYTLGRQGRAGALILSMLALSLTGCEARDCQGKQDVYDDDSVLPANGNRVRGVMAQLTTQQSLDVVWGPSEQDVVTDDSLLAPYAGADVLFVAVSHDGEPFTSSYWWSESDTCQADHNPTTAVSIHVWTESGLLDETYETELRVDWDGNLIAEGALDTLKGEARELEHQLGEARSSVELDLFYDAQGTLRAASAQLVVSSRVANGDSAEYHTLFVGG